MGRGASPPGPARFPGTTLGGCLAALLLLAGSTIPSVPAARAQPVPGQVRAAVLEIVDGDTVRVLLGGEERTVRLIGIDAPEEGHPSRPVEFFGAEAAELLASLCAGKTVLLETDREESDRHGRLLRYLFLPPPDGRLVNLEMVRQGAARVLTRYPFSRKDEFLRGQERAMRTGAGVWRDEGMAEVRWLAERRPDPVRVYPAGGGRYAVVLAGWGRPAVRRKDVGRWAGTIARLREEFSDADFPREARRAGFFPVPGTAGGTPDADSAEAPAPGTLSFEAAGRHVGRPVTVEGRIVRTHRDRSALHLNFHPNWKRYLSIRVPAEELGRFPASPEEIYRGRRIRVTGTVILSGEAPQIVVRSPGAITLLPSPSPPPAGSPADRR